MRRRLTAILLTISLLFSFAVIFASADSVQPGDVNDDGKITASDARKTLRASAKLEELTEEQLKIADVDLNGRVSAADARLILRVSAKLDSFPQVTPEETTKADETTKQEETTKVPETTTKQDETTTKKPEVTTLPNLEPGVVVDEYPEAIDAFFNGSFYLDGKMVDGTNSMPIKMATGKLGTEIAVAIPDSALNISIYVKGKDTYMKLSSGDRKHYVDLSDTFKDEMGVDFSEIMSQLTAMKFNNPGKPVLTKAVYNDIECDVYTFSNEESASIKFYAVEERIIQISLADADTVESNIEVNELTGKIPSNMLTTRGYTKASLLTLPVLYPELGGSF